MKWDYVLKSALLGGKRIWDEDVTDADVYFPQKHSIEFLKNQHRSQGSYVYANQYDNEVIPDDARTFRRTWFQYYDQLPKRIHTFIHIDPAISQADTADFTGVVVVSVDSDKKWYVRFARRYKITPTQIIELVFNLAREFDPQSIGVEDVAYQKSLIYFLYDEMRRRDIVLPVHGVTPPNTKTKQMRILSLVPRIEWGHMLFAQGLYDLEMELLQFPRGAHDDIIDALASIEYSQFPPSKEKSLERKLAPNHPDYERQYIHNLTKKGSRNGGQ